MAEVAGTTDRVWHAVDHIKEVRKKSGEFEALVSWKGFRSSSETCAPLIIIYEDVPTKVLYFFNSTVKTRTITGTMKFTRL